MKQLAFSNLTGIHLQNSIDRLACKTLISNRFFTALIGLKYKFIFSLSLSISFLCSLAAQQSSELLSYEAFIEQVLAEHPMAKQAALKLELAGAERLSAKGNLDPYLNTNWSGKNFDTKEYYQYFDSKINIPTPLGIDLVAGYEQAGGIYINPEKRTDRFGLWHVGVEANLLQGLWINDRRIGLKQADVLQNIYMLQNQQLRNELVYQAAVSYVKWQEQYQVHLFMQQNIERAERYFEDVKQAFFAGEKTAMDTLETLSIIQTVRVLALDNEVYLAKARQEVNQHLWQEEQSINLDQNTVPQQDIPALFAQEASVLSAQDINQLPEVAEKTNKLTYYEWEQRLKKEKLKPKLKAKFNPLIATSDESIEPLYASADYKWGLQFEMPILFRSQRADVQKGRIKIEDLSLELDYKRTALENKLIANAEQQRLLEQQLSLQSTNTTNYALLLDAENEKLNYGESSVFLLNKRQEKYIQSELKRLALQAKLYISKLDYLYYTNQLVE